MTKPFDCANRNIRYFLTVLLMFSWIGISNAAFSLTPDLSSNCLATLREGMEHGIKWVRIHGGEDLAQLGYPDEAEKFFRKELAEHGGDAEYRIGIWRVLAQSAPQESRGEWTNRIRNAFLDRSGPDRGHAAETLGKLGYKPGAKGDEEFSSIAHGTNGELAVFARWVLADSGEPADQMQLAEMFDHWDPKVRGNAAYALRFLPRLQPETFQKLMSALEKEPSGSSARVYLACTLFVHASPENRRRFKPGLLKFTASADPKERYEACWGFAKAGTKEDLPALEKLLRDADLDVRVSAANAILRIGRREAAGPR